MPEAGFRLARVTKSRFLLFSDTGSSTAQSTLLSKR